MSISDEAKDGIACDQDENMIVEEFKDYNCHSGQSLAVSRGGGHAQTAFSPTTSLSEFNESLAGTATAPKLLENESSIR